MLREISATSRDFKNLAGKLSGYIELRVLVKYFPGKFDLDLRNYMSFKSSQVISVSYVMVELIIPSCGYITEKLYLVAFFVASGLRSCFSEALVLVWSINWNMESN